MKTLSRLEWMSLALEHKREVNKLLGDYMDRRSRHEKDPILDFLFEYYAFRPSHLERWSPGLNVKLEIEPIDAEHLRGFSIENNLAWVDPNQFPEKRAHALDWVIALLDSTMQRSPSFHCGGMHEWAMVYASKDRRHEHAPLRMSRHEIDAFVSTRPLGCSHYDAFRFFTEPAVPLNRFSLTREAMTEFEQPGCLHANMDVYKWAFKFFPWVSSDIILDAFKMAVAARTVDMQASPYDWSDWGLSPIKIETIEGQAFYRQEQLRIYEWAKPIRIALLKSLEGLREQWSVSA